MFTVITKELSLAAPQEVADALDASSLSASAALPFEANVLCCRQLALDDLWGVLIDAEHQVAVFQNVRNIGEQARDAPVVNNLAALQGQIECGTLPRQTRRLRTIPRKLPNCIYRELSERESISVQPYHVEMVAQGRCIGVLLFALRLHQFTDQHLLVREQVRAGW
jgi:hypothetical protein